MTLSSPLLDPKLRVALVAAIRKRVPESEVEDLVQATLAEAIASKSAPADPEALRRWVWGVARNKVADFFRHARREQLDVPDVAADSAPHSENDLLRWATRELPPGEDAEETLDWLLREGEGEKLETIALTEQVPAPRVRQRVSRLRKHFRTRWAKEVAALAALGILAVVLFFVLRREEPRKPIAKDVPSAPLRALESPIELAKKQRQKALEDCDARAWRDCLEGLDGAAALDPSGDSASDVVRARAAAKAALAPVPSESAAPVPPPTSMPSSMPAPVPTPAPTAVTLPFTSEPRPSKK